MFQRLNDWVGDLCSVNGVIFPICGTVAHSMCRLSANLIETELIESCIVQIEHE